MNRKKRKANIYYIPYSREEKDGIKALQHVLIHKTYRLISSFWTKSVVCVTVHFDQSNSQSLSRTEQFAGMIGELLVKHDVSAFLGVSSERHLDLDCNGVEQMIAFQDLFSSSLPVFMLDGINGTNEYAIRKRGRAGDIYLSGDIKALDGFILFDSLHRDKFGQIQLLSNILGHKLASRRGKTLQMTLDKPRVDSSKCYACGKCVHVCPTSAISLVNNCASIDSSKCVDCGRCVMTARYCGISYMWNADKTHFNDMTLQYAAEAGKIISKKSIYIRELADQNIFDPPLGILVSKDPVALDSLLIDILDKRDLEGDEQLRELRELNERAAAQKLGNLDYQVHTIAF